MNSASMARTTAGDWARAQRAQKGPDPISARPHFCTTPQPARTAACAETHVHNGSMGSVRRKGHAQKGSDPFSAQGPMGSDPRSARTTACAEMRRKARPLFCTTPLTNARPLRSRTLVRRCPNLGHSTRRNTPVRHPDTPRARWCPIDALEPQRAKKGPDPIPAGRFDGLGFDGLGPHSCTTLAGALFDVLEPQRAQKGPDPIPAQRFDGLGPHSCDPNSDGQRAQKGSDPFSAQRFDGTPFLHNDVALPTRPGCRRCRARRPSSSCRCSRD